MLIDMASEATGSESMLANVSLAIGDLSITVEELEARVDSV